MPSSRLTVPLLGRAALIAAAAAGFAAACAHKPPPPAPVASTPSAPYAPSYGPSPPVSSAPIGPVPGSQQDFVVNVGDRVYFDTDQYTVSGEGAAILSKQAGWLNRYSTVGVRIEGNCDERGTREYNFALGARRADAVKAFLVGRGVNPGRINTISYGKEKPLDPGTGEDSWAHNRNGHTALVSGAQ